MTERNSWGAAAQARVSDRWATASAEWNTAMTDALLAAAPLNPDSVVLDLAAGSGDPALTEAPRHWRSHRFGQLTYRPSAY
jgi:ubiquinone/menaquinone biosynthesis C-methylase UbiE